MKYIFSLLIFLFAFIPIHADQPTFPPENIIVTSYGFLVKKDGELYFTPSLMCVDTRKYISLSPPMPVSSEMLKEKFREMIE